MIELKKVAVAVCDWDNGDRFCTEVADFTRPAYWYNDNDMAFTEAAFLYFIEKGWNITTQRNLCPYCAAGRPTDD